MSYELVKDSSYIALLHQGLINGRMVKKISAQVSLPINRPLSCFPMKMAKLTFELCFITAILVLMVAVFMNGAWTFLNTTGKIQSIITKVN